MSNHRLAVYQIEVLDFARNHNGHQRDVVIPDAQGIYKCGRCGWEGQQQNQCPKCDNKQIFPRGRIKLVDRVPIAPRRTVMGGFFNHKSAKRWGERFGTVISCHKVDKSYYLENIEHLNLKQEPVTIELEQEDFVLNKALELERPRRKSDGGKIIEIAIDKE